jgi:YVTN family beta-propeller protein
MDSLRRAAIVTAIVAASACFAAATASAAPLVWTVNSAKGSVSTIDSGTNALVGSEIPVGELPLSIAITPDGRQALVASHGGKRVTAVNTKLRTPKAIPVAETGELVERIAISPDGKTAYFTTESNEEVFVIDTKADEVVGSFPVGPEADALAFSPDGTRAYVGTEEGVDVVNTATEKVVAEPIDVGGIPREIVVGPNGKAVYVVAATVKSVAVINPANNQVTTTIPLAAQPTSIAVSPDGRRLYATSESAGTVTVVETVTNQTAGSPIVVGGAPSEIALTPDGRTAYVASGEKVTPIDLSARVVAKPIPTTGFEVEHLVVAPDQSPTAAFTPPAATATLPATFDGSASTDPDGTVASWEWAFGEGALASGPSVSHIYALPGTYNAKLSVIDNEGCGSEEVFTGRTAYCSGGAATIGHPVVAALAPVTPVLPPACTAKFSFGALVHNRNNGTARLQVKLPAAGSLLLFGKKVHAVTRKTKAKGSMFLTIHARVELNKRLKKIHHTSVRVRVTFTPAAGCGFKTVHRSFSLQRAPKHRH